MDNRNFINELYEKVAEKALVRVEKEKETDYSQGTLELISLTIELNQEVIKSNCSEDKIDANNVMVNTYKYGNISVAKALSTIL